MSALAQPLGKTRVFNTIRVAVRGGEIVWLKRCSGPCGEEKVCRLGPDSDFPRNGTKANGRPAWKAQCKVCNRVTQREYLAKNRAHIRALHRAAYHQRVATDPAYVEHLRVQSREQKRKDRKDPVKRERMLVQARANKRRYRQQDPDRINETYRLWYALTREREGRPLGPRKTVIDGTQPRWPVPPFRRWLEKYKEQTGYSVSELASELDMTERRVRSVLDGEFPRVALDTVCRALTNAKCVITVNGVDVVNVDDLYREGGEMNGLA